MFKTFAQIGACVCALIGALYCVATAELLIERAFHSATDAMIFIAYTLFAFVPFVIFIYPKAKTRFKLVAVCAGVLELLIVGLFCWNILTIDR